MKFNIAIPTALKAYYDKEIESYRVALKEQNWSTAWQHLERSHIIGQSYPFEHSYSHWLMLKFGFRHKDFREIVGQLIRLLVGGWKSFIDHVPKGNTGGSNVPPLKKMEVPADLKFILNQHN